MTVQEATGRQRFAPGPSAAALARVAYDVTDPTVGGSALHVLLEIPDQVGSTAAIIDRDSAELVERRAYQGYGVVDSDYRPTRWDSFRESYGFSGKEDDQQFGILYVGNRFYSPNLNRWASPDPLALHKLGKGDPNLYAYVRGRVFASVDSNGLDPVTITAILVATAVGAGIAATENVAMQVLSGHGWSWKSFGIAVISGAVAGAAGEAVGGAFGIQIGANAAPVPIGTRVAMGAASGFAGSATAAILQNENLLASGGEGALFGAGLSVLGKMTESLNTASNHVPSTLGAGATGSVGESIAVGIAGGAIAYGSARLLGAGPTSAGAIAAAGIGATSGFIAGARETYDWSHPSGWFAFGLDSSWGLPGTALGLGLYAADVGSGTFDAADSYRQNRFVFNGGAYVKQEDYFTLGNVTSNASDVTSSEGITLLNQHEDLHIWQSRTFGPGYEIGTIGTWAAGAPLTGYGLLTGNNLDRSGSTGFYCANPFEGWAYRSQGYYPGAAGPGQPAPAIGAMLYW